MRYAYAITAALLIGGAAATVASQQPTGGGVAQNAPEQMAGMAPRPGAPMSFADLTAKLAGYGAGARYMTRALDRTETTAC